MARAPRIEIPGGIYHLGSRGNRGCQIYMDDHERKVFLRMFGRLSKRHGWQLGTYCLMMLFICFIGPDECSGIRIISFNLLYLFAF